MPSASRRSLEKLLHPRRKGHRDKNSRPSTASSSSAAPSPTIARTSADKHANRGTDYADIHSSFQNLTLDAQYAPASNENLKTNGGVQVSWVGQPPNGDSQMPKSVPIYAAGDPYACKVAEWNVLRNETVLSGGLEDSHAIRRALEQDDQEPERTSPPQSIPARTSSLRLNSTPVDPLSLDHLLHHQPLTPAYEVQDERRIFQHGADTHTLPQSVDKCHAQPCGKSGNAENNVERIEPHIIPRNRKIQHWRNRNPAHFAQDVEQPIDLSGVVDLRGTEDTDIQQRYAPAVTHETVRVDTHEIRHEVIDRDMHNHDVFHRILPINDIEVLPPRHFIPTPNGGLYEITPEQAPGGVQQSMRLHRAMQKAASSVISSGREHGEQHFSARSFEGEEGDHRAWQTGDGVECSERTWVHPPTLETGAQKTGQSVPVTFGIHVPIGAIKRK